MRTKYSKYFQFFRVRRPNYGDPKMTATYWKGLLTPNRGYNQKLDGAVHIRPRDSLEGKTFFFKG